EFLDALEGMEENSGVVTIGSTNHPEMLDWALVDRPGRFDVRIDFDYPEPEFVVAILRKYLSRTTHEKGIDLKKLGRSCAGLSGAHLQEIVSQAGLIAFEENNQKMDFSISKVNLEDALNRTLYNRRRYQEERQLRSKDDYDGGMTG
ncbi:MAG: AAA family ATPase, partial [Candidatus Poseidoniales archaeon]|nr:AAA family ATPase [Candidatus Poseidoniales archaeon]